MKSLPKVLLVLFLLASAGAQTVNPASAVEPEYALLLPMSALQRRADTEEKMMWISFFAGDRDNQIYFQGRADNTKDLIKMLNDAIPKPAPSVTPQ